MTREEVDARLRAAARLSGERARSVDGIREQRERAREARQTAVVDMSARAIDLRLREASELSALCASLARRA